MSEVGSVAEEVEDGKRNDFICGVVEGFYGRPWTTEQRKDLFQKMKKWGMDMYVYAPKDDYKHRAYWRELYTVEEAEHLTSLIAAAKAQGVSFCYALSPGLDITYSNQKEITCLKRKLEQVSQFGCTSFALLFDDIDTEMSEADKQIFQSFAHAQVSVTNEMYQHLGGVQFLLCPTQYCAARATPDVPNSEYLNTLGTKLAPEIHIMWTGPKVISKTLTVESIREITQVLRRAPVIWDNLHANDYDQKRLFLGPYCGRSPGLIPLLRGVLTNPNCEYNANMVAISTLAHWARCRRDPPVECEAVSWDIKLERESELGVCEDEPVCADRHVYNHRAALRQAIDEWLPEFNIDKTTSGPVIKPQSTITTAIAPVPIVPIMPSINTCMSLTTTTASTTTSAADLPIPTVSTSQLRALAEVCHDRPAVDAPISESFNPPSNPIMNSLVSASKVVLNESIPNPIVPLASSQLSMPSELPVSTLPVPMMGLKSLDARGGGDDKEQVNGDEHERTIDASILETDSFVEELKKEEIIDVVETFEAPANGAMSVEESPIAMSPATMSLREVNLADSDVVMADGCSENGSMQVEPSGSPVGSDMLVEVGDTPVDECRPEPESTAMTADDLLLLCDLFYLPFEHGARALRLLNDMQWLITHAGNKSDGTQACEWRARRCRFAWWAARARRLARRLGAARNRELHDELQPYVWDVCAVLALLDGFARWLELGKYPPNIANYAQGTYTWFSKGWREAFECGSQEPWVFRGGLAADLRRLVPVECGGAELRPAGPGVPATVRPYRYTDEPQVRAVCHATCRDGSDCSELFPPDLQALAEDRLVMPFLTLCPELVLVLEDDEAGALAGYACGALDARAHHARAALACLPGLRERYPLALLERNDLSAAAKECIRRVHEEYAVPECVSRAHPALLALAVSPACRDAQAAARLATCALATLRANGVTGVHACVNSTDLYLTQLYGKLGFVELHRDTENNRAYLGRGF